jgi:hypothetical protein
MVRHVRERLDRGRDTVDQVVILVSDADPAVFRKRTACGHFACIRVPFPAEPVPRVRQHPPDEMPGVGATTGTSHDARLHPRASASAASFCAPAPDEQRERRSRLLLRSRNRQSLRAESTRGSLLPRTTSSSAGLDCSAPPKPTVAGALTIPRSEAGERDDRRPADSVASRVPERSGALEPLRVRRWARDGRPTRRALRR